MLPIEGLPAGLWFGGQTLFVWWGQDADGNDCVAADGARVLTFASENDCWTTADASGWRAAFDRTEVDEPAAIAALDPALDWLKGKRIALDPVSALDLWNWAADLAFSTGQSWHDRSPQLDRCYEKLVAANVPWLFDQTAYRPRWTPTQIRSMRGVLGRAVHVLRAL